MEDNSDSKLNSFDGLFYDSGSSSHDTEKKYRSKSERKVKNSLGGGEDDLYHRKKDDGTGMFVQSIDFDDEVSCAACGFEKTFVPEGMIYCSYCKDVQYCSVHCRDWDWTSGQHFKSCGGHQTDHQTDHQTKPSYSSVSTPINQSVLNVAVVTPDTTMNLTQDDDTTSSQGIMEVDCAFNSNDAPNTVFARSESKKTLNKDENPISGTTNPRVTIATNMKEEILIDNNKEDTSMSRLIGQMIQPEHNESTTTSEMTRQSETITQSLQYDTYTQPLQSGIDTPRTCTIIENDINELNNSNIDEMKCMACGFEADFVENGLIPCQYCKIVFYCSHECRDWDWKRGNHSKTCISSLQRQQSYRTTHMQRMYPSQRQKSQRMMQLSTSLHSTAYHTLPPKPSSSDDGNNSSLSSVDFSLAVDIVTQESMPLLGFIRPPSNKDGTIPGTVQSMKTSKAPSTFKSIQLVHPTSSKDSCLDDNTKLTDDVFAEESNKNEHVCSACGVDADMLEDAMICDLTSFKKFCSVECRTWHITQQNTNHSRTTMLHANTSSAQIHDIRTLAQEEVSDEESNDQNDDSNRSIKYENVQDIFVIEEKESQYASPRVRQSKQAVLTKPSPRTVSPVQMTTLESNEEKSHNSITRDKDEMAPCSVCGFESEFVEGGMLRSTHVATRVYCSNDCLEWDDLNHTKNAKMVTNEERKKRNSDTLIEYETIQDIFIIPEQESQYASPRTKQPRFIEPNEASSSLNLPPTLPSSDQTTQTTDNNPQNRIENVACTVCGFESDFVEGGMLFCVHDDSRVYCSAECQEWDLQKHQKATTIVTSQQTKNDTTDTLIDYDDVNDIFIIPMNVSQYESPVRKKLEQIESNKVSKSTTVPVEMSVSDQTTHNVQSHNAAVACTVCGFESEFVEGGMLRSADNAAGVYCSNECLEWDVQKYKDSTTLVASPKSQNAMNDTNIDYANIKDIFDVSGQESRYGCPDRTPPIHTENEVGTAKASIPVPSSALDGRNSTIHTTTTGNNEVQSCSVCGFESEFVEGGMLLGTHDVSRVYCSNECLEWDAQKHITTTKLVVVNDPVSDTNIEYDTVQDIFNDPEKESRYDTPDTKLPVDATDSADKNAVASCSVCGFESEFVEGGMLLSTRDVSRVYCSNECLEWDAQKHITTTKLVVVNDPVSDTNIEYDTVQDIFNDPEKESRYDTPDTKLPADSNDSATNADVRVPLPLSDVRNIANEMETTGRDKDAIACSVCDFEAEFVEGGMLRDGNDLSRMYCSSECLEWDIQNHKLKSKTSSSQKENNAGTDTYVGYDSVQDIFDAPGKESRYNSPVLKQPVHVTTDQSTSNTRILEQVPLPDRNMTIEKDEFASCSVCGFEAEFVEGGMLHGGDYAMQVYCSPECLEWYVQQQEKTTIIVKVVTDTQMTYDNVEDIFTVPDEGSRYDNLDTDRTLPVDSNDATANGKVQIQSPQLVDNKNEKQNKIKDNDEVTSCSVCGFESEFVEGGMLRSDHDGSRVFCSNECLEWEVQRHQESRVTHIVLSDKEIEYDNVKDIFHVPENGTGSRYEYPISERHIGSVANELTTTTTMPLSNTTTMSDHNSTHFHTASGQEALQCTVCGFEAEFVEGGMIHSSHNSYGVFCSSECLEWDLQNLKKESQSVPSRSQMEGNNGSRPLLNTRSDTYYDDENVNDDASIEYDDAKDIFVIEIKESQYASPIKEEGQHFDSSKSPMNSSLPSQLRETTSHIPSLDEDKKDPQKEVKQNNVTASLPPKEDEAPTECKVCGFESTFVEEGMINCRFCQDIIYCSVECLEWDWKSGGHNVTCSRKEASNPVSCVPKQFFSQFDSISSCGNERSPQQSREEEVTECNVCSFESTFVEEGMISCKYCENATYCSVECRDWDWKSGDHRKLCIGKVRPRSLSAEGDNSSCSGIGATLKLMSNGESNSTSFRTIEEGKHSTECASPFEYESRKALEAFNGDYDGTNFYVDDDDASVSMEDLRDEESTQLKSIREEGSECSEEPVNEGSWRSRTPFLSGEDVSVTASQCILPGTDRDVQASSTLFSQQSQTTVPTTNVSRKKKATDYAMLGSFEIRISKKADVGGNRKDMHFPYKNAMEDSTLNNRSGATLEYSDSVSDELSTFFEDTEHRGKTAKKEWKEKEGAPIVDSIDHEQGSSARTSKQKIAPEIRSAPKDVKPQVKSSSFDAIVRENHHDQETIRSILETETKPSTIKNGVSLATKERSEEKSRHSSNDCKSSGPKVNVEAAASNYGKECESSRCTGSKSAARSDYVFEGKNQRPNHCTIDHTETFGDSLSAITFPSLEEGSDGINKSYAGNGGLQSRATVGPWKRPEAPSKSGETIVDGGNSISIQTEGRLKSNSTSLQESTPVVEPTMAMLKESFKRALREIKESFGEETAERLCYHLANVMNTEEDQTPCENTTASIFENYSSLFTSQGQDTDGEATIHSASNSRNAILDNQTIPTNSVSDSSRYSSYRSTLESHRPTTKADSPSLAILVMSDIEGESESDSSLLGNESMVTDQDTTFSPKALHHNARYVVYRGKLGSSSRKRSHDETEAIRATNGTSTSYTEEMLDKKMLSPKRSRYLSYRLSLRSSSLPMVTDIVEYPAANWVEKMLKPTACITDCPDSNENHIEHGCEFIATSVSLYTDCAGKTKSSSKSPVEDQTNEDVDNNINYGEVTPSDAVAPAHQACKNFVPRYHQYRTSLIGNTSKQDSSTRHQIRLGHIEDSNSVTVSNAHIPTSTIVGHMAEKRTKNLPSYLDYRSSLISKLSKHSTESMNEQKENNTEGRSTVFELKGDEQTVRNVESELAKDLLHKVLDSSHSGTNEKSSNQNALSTSRNVNCPHHVESLRGTGHVTLLTTTGAHRVIERLAISKYSQYRNALQTKTNPDPDVPVFSTCSTSTAESVDPNTPNTEGRQVLMEEENCVLIVEESNCDNTAVFNIAEPLVPTTNLLHLDENCIDVEKKVTVPSIQRLNGSPEYRTLDLPQNEVGNSWLEADSDIESEERKRLQPTSIYANDIQNPSSYNNEGVTQLEEYQGLRDSGLELQMTQTHQSDDCVLNAEESNCDNAAVFNIAEPLVPTTNLLHLDENCIDVEKRVSVPSIQCLTGSPEYRTLDLPQNEVANSWREADSDIEAEERQPTSIYANDIQNPSSYNNEGVTQLEEFQGLQDSCLELQMTRVTQTHQSPTDVLGTTTSIVSQMSRHSEVERGTDDIESTDDESTQGSNISNLEMGTLHDIHSGKLHHGEANEISKSKLSHRACSEQMLSARDMERLLFDDDSGVDPHVDPDVDPQVEEENKIRGELIRKARLRTIILIVLMIALPIGVGLGVRSNGEGDVSYSKPNLRQTKSPNASPPTTSSPPPSAAYFQSEKDLLQLLIPFTFDGGNSLISSTTPQGQAFNWLLNDINSTNISNDRKIQRFALAAVYYGTNGGTWTFSDKWLTGENECTWYSSSQLLATSCDDNGLMANLDLSLNNLSGSLPPEIGLLKQLSSLDLSSTEDRQINGGIPSEIGLLTKLTALNLRGNDFNGTIPTAVFDCKELDSLNLGRNSLSGAIPSEVAKLTILRHLELTSNRIVGDVPAIVGQMKSLVRLHLDDNHLTGTLPSSLGDLSNLETIDLRKNHFTSVPATIANLQKLDSLDLSENDIAGQLFSEIGLMTSLVKLDLHSNSFSGFMPTSIGLLSKLRLLDLASNRFLGSIPTQIGQLSLLTMLDLHRNGFNGEIPSQIGMLTELQTIRFEENSLQGTVPEAVCYSISKSLTSFALDCGSANGTPEVTCTQNTCCTICCTDGLGCQCQYEGSGLDFLCSKTTRTTAKDGDY